MKFFAARVMISFSLLLSAASPLFAGALSGAAFLDGEAPAREAIDLSVDSTCSALHREPLLNEDVLVDEDGSLQNVFVYVKEGLEGRAFEAPSEVVKLQQNGCSYAPRVFGVMVDQPIEIMNGDATLHNVRALPEESRPFNLGMPIQGMKLKKRFSSPEIMVKFKCDVHPWMRAYAGVLEHPFYAVSGEDGSFEITDLPAGTYVLEAWHEVYGIQTQQVTLQEEGSAQVDFHFKA